MNPSDMGGAPTTMTSNDWWKTAADVLTVGLQTYGNIESARRLSAIPARAGVISSTPMNQPPGTQGLNAQKSSTPGGLRMPFLSSPGSLLAGNAGWILGGVALLVVVVVLLKR